jgi:7-cyano-7-deazaguanine synthase
MNSKGIAILGANGYLGINLTKKALSRGLEVKAIVRREEVVKDLESLGAEVSVVKDFEIDVLKKIFSNCDVVFHFANVVCGSKEIFQRINVDALKNILEASKLAKVSRIIYPSGLGVDKYNEIDWAKNEYFRTKFEAEKLIQESGLPYVIFRPSYILGPKDELIPEIINQIIDGEIIIVGTGDVPMKPIYLDDALSAFLSAAFKENSKNKIYTLVGPQITTMNELVEMVILKVCESGFNVPRPKISHIPYNQAPEKLDLCIEMVDVMRCDLTPDGGVTAKELGINLSPLSKAIETAIFAEIGIKPNDYDEKRAILLLSGGVDSATSLYWGIKQGFQIIALSLLYKWRAKNEILAARMLTEKTNIKLIEIPIPFIQQATDLKMEGFPIPSVTQAPQGFIPMKNLLFYSIAAYFAEAYGCKFIIGGHISADTQTFPDTTPNFFNLLSNLINSSKSKSDKNKIEFLFPLIDLNKSEVIKLARELEVPFEHTWSCYGDFTKPCNECIPCLNRKKAFFDNELIDPEFKIIENGRISL